MKKRTQLWREAHFKKALREIAEDGNEMWSQITGAPLPTRSEADEDQGYQIGFDVLRSPCGTVYHRDDTVAIFAALKWDL